MRAPGFHIALDGLAGCCSILKVHLYCGVWSRPPDVLYLPIPPCVKDSKQSYPTAALPRKKPRCMCGSQAVNSLNKHNTIASVACFESLVSPPTWLMLSTQLPLVYGAAVGTQQMYFHRLSVLISFLHAHASTNSASASPSRPLPRPGVSWRLWVFARCTTSKILHGGICTNPYQPA